MLADNYRSSFDTAGMRWGFPPCHRHRLCPNTVGAHASCLLLHISAEMQRPTSLGECAKQTPSRPQASQAATSTAAWESLESFARQPPNAISSYMMPRHRHTHNGPPFLHPVQVPPRRRHLLCTVCVAASTAVDCISTHLCSPATENPQTTGGQPRSSFHGDSELLAPSSSSHRGAG
jgi:hypothetical protein